MFVCVCVFLWVALLCVQRVLYMFCGWWVFMYTSNPPPRSTHWLISNLSNLNLGVILFSYPGENTGIDMCRGRNNSNDSGTVVHCRTLTFVVVRRITTGEKLVVRLNFQMVVCGLPLFQPKCMSDSDWILLNYVLLQPIYGYVETDDDEIGRNPVLHFKDKVLVYP